MAASEVVTVPAAFWLAVAFAFGAVIGSFLNVVIWRLPRGESLSHPGSHCPHCNRALTAWENVPLLSFLILRARCRTCRTPITWRYFWVELLTALVFTAIEWRFGASYDTVAFCLFMAALVAAFAIDLELYIIPDELNTFALLVGIGRDVVGIVRGEAAHALLWGWCPRSVLGAVACAAVFVGIQVLGRALFRKDAMGDGDVKLARAIGALLPMRLALVSFGFAIAAGAVLGPILIAAEALRAKRQGLPATGQADGADEPEMDVSTWPELLGAGAAYLTFFDLALGAWQRLVGPAKGGNNRLAEETEPDFVAGPTQIPFGPYMVIGVLAAMFVGDSFVHWYLRWSGLGG